MGPPGAGKGTQGERLAARLEVQPLATGDMIRAALKGGTPMGERLRVFYETGDLVPDDVVLGLVAEALDRRESAGGFLLDGFPRTVAQADGLALTAISTKSTIRCGLIARGYGGGACRAHLRSARL